MDTQDSASTDDAALERRLTDWLEKNLGGKVTGIERQGRWRPAWFVDMEDTNGPKRSYVRGERTSKSVMFPLRYEYNILNVLEANGVPVPHVYGICPIVSRPCPTAGSPIA